MIRTSIPEGIDPPSHLLPRRLDKPIHSATSLTYADILKKQFSLASTPTTTANVNHPPPQKRQATLLEYDPDAPVTLLATTNSVNTTITSVHTTTVDYAAELQLIKTELASLRTLISSAVEQMQSAVASINTNPVQTSTMETKAMEIEADQSTDANHFNDAKPEISDLITELKNDLAIIAVEMREKFQELRAPPQPIPFQMTPFPT